MKALVVTRDIQAFRMWCRRYLPVKEVETLRSEYVVMKNGDSFIYVSQIEALRGHRHGTARVLLVWNWGERPDAEDLLRVVRDNFEGRIGEVFA